MTRITLDLDALTKAGELTEIEAERLKALAITGRAKRIIANLLCIFGAIALATGVLAFKPDPTLGLFLALIAVGTATCIRVFANEEWSILADGLAIAGTGGLAGWMVVEHHETVHPILINIALTGLALVSAIAFKQAFIAAFVPLALGAVIGSGTAYWHASYGLFVREATLTIIVFSTLTAFLMWLHERIAGGSMRSWALLALIPARVSFFMVNFGFWVGSLWGDWVGDHFASRGERRCQELQAWRETAFFIPEIAFVVGWAVFLAACIWLGLKRHDRFLTNTAIVFLGIHFYTQLFELLGGNPIVLVLGGLTLLGGAVALFRFDRFQYQQKKP